MSEGSEEYQIEPYLGPTWYPSEPSDVPYSLNQFLGWDFFCCFLQQDGSSGIS